MQDVQQDMHNRFKRYIFDKDLSQAKLSKLSGVSTSTISRFCLGEAISSDKLLLLLQVCDDLSLEWLFYGTGDMIRKYDTVNINMGAFAGSDIATGESVLVKNSSKFKVQQQNGDRAVQAALAEKDRIIAEKDRVIGERDAMILKLHEMLLAK